MSDKLKLTLSTLDYFIFWLMLLLSCIIGLYYGFFAKKKQNTRDEYLLGSKNMKAWPVAISLTAT
jgi:sodium-coupled monocarboxylate transporter 8/12